MLRKIGKYLGGFVVTALVLGLVIYIATGPTQPPRDSGSAAWLEPGPYTVAQAEFIFVDDSRPTNENRGNPGAPDRTFPTTVWYPQDLDGDHPLVIHSHGILSSRSELPYLMEQLASYGYVVAAADYPLTSASTPGGANANDAINQPTDVSFLIDSVLNLSADEKPFSGNIDTNRIALTGYSLGGLTTLLTTYHPRLRDPRIMAAVAIAGPAVAFTEQFYTNSDIPLLMISGTADALIDHGLNAAIVPERNPGTKVLTIDGGSHLGFIGAAEPMFRFMHNPDSLGCGAVLAALGEDSNAVFADLGSVDEGVYLAPGTPGVCELMPLRETSHPGRQHMITQIAALSFLESVFAENESSRSAAELQLSATLSQDFEEASFIP